MADMCDYANIAIERELELNLQRRVIVPRVTGKCVWCGDVCEGVYCCTECRDDHEQFGGQK